MSDFLVNSNDFVDFLDASMPAYFEVQWFFPTPPLMIASGILRVHSPPLPSTFLAALVGVSPLAYLTPSFYGDDFYAHAACSLSILPIKTFSVFY